MSSDDLEGLRLLRDRGPVGMSIAAGEYGYDLFYFHDHARIEELLFDGAPPLREGALCRTQTRRGWGWRCASTRRSATSADAEHAPPRSAGSFDAGSFDATRQ